LQKESNYQLSAIFSTPSFYLRKQLGFEKYKSVECIDLALIQSTLTTQYNFILFILNSQIYPKLIVK